MDELISNNKRTKSTTNETDEKRWVIISLQYIRPFGKEL